MAHAKDCELVARNPIENKIRIGLRDKSAKASFPRQRSSLRMRLEKRDHGLDPRLDVCCPLRRALVEVGKHVLQFVERARSVTNFHSPCLAQKAAATSSGTNSPRSA